MGALDSLTIITMLKVVLLSSFLVLSISRPYPYRPFGVRRTPAGDFQVDEQIIAKHAWSGFRYEEAFDDHAKSQLGMRSQGRQPLAVRSTAPKELWRQRRKLANDFPSISNFVYRRTSRAAFLHNIIQSVLVLPYMWFVLKELGTQPARPLRLIIAVYVLPFLLGILLGIASSYYLSFLYVGIENTQQQEIRDSDGRRWSGEIIAPRQTEMKYPTRFPRLAKSLYTISSQREAIYSVIRDYIPTLLVVSGILAAFVLMDSLETKVVPVIEVLLRRIGLRRLRAYDLLDILYQWLRKDLIWICGGTLLVVIVFLDSWSCYIEYLRASGRELHKGQ